VSSDDFGFPGLPIDPIPAGRTVLVTGPSRLASRFARELVFGGDHEDGVIFISTSTTGNTVATDTRIAYPELDFSRFGIVDATGQTRAGSETAARIEQVSSAADLTGISIKNSILASHLKESGVDRLRTCFDSLSLLLLYTNFRTIMRFVHTMDGRIAATDGLGVFVLDPSMHEPQVTYTLKSVCDGAIEVRQESATPDIRIDGFGTYAREWEAIEL